MEQLDVLGTSIAYCDSGDRNATAVVFLHGNPTSSYLWRNVIPVVEPVARCLAPDLVGMGESGPPKTAPAERRYTFDDHSRHLAAWLDALELRNLILVGHDWGGALGFDWAARHEDRVRGMVFMETLVRPVAWADWPDNARGIFQAMRSPAGEEIVLEKNFFVERILPASMMRKLDDEEMETYRRPFKEAGESRRPTLTWPRQIPVDGEPEDVVARVEAYDRWLESSDVPKLFINAEPGSILVGPQREYVRGWPNLTEVTVKGLHFIQEDSPVEIGEAVREFVLDLSAW